MNVLFNFNTTDAARPSFFEMYIQSQMMPSLKPAMKYIMAVRQQALESQERLNSIAYPLVFLSLPDSDLCFVSQILSQKFPNLRFAHKYSDELFYAGLFVLERHFLRQYGMPLIPRSQGLQPHNYPLG
jgi:hypothetical protein